MSSFWDLLVAATPDQIGQNVWVRMNNLGSGGGVGQVIGNLLGSAVTTYNITGQVIIEELGGSVIEEELGGVIQIEDVSATIEDNNLEGKII